MTKNEILEAIAATDASILLKMKEKLGEEKYKDFIRNSKIGFVSKGIMGGNFIFIQQDYILNPSLLIDKASEWLEKEGK